MNALRTLMPGLPLGRPIYERPGGAGAGGGDGGAAPRADGAPPTPALLRHVDHPGRPRRNMLFFAQIPILHSPVAHQTSQVAQ